MKTRLLLAFCLVWMLGCGNRDHGDVDTGFGPLAVAEVIVCNDRNCLGGVNDGLGCDDDSDCPGGGTCDMLAPLKECKGGSVQLGTACETEFDCGRGCVGGSRLPGFECIQDSDCGGECLGGRLPDGSSCLIARDCGFECSGGLVPDGQACQQAAECGRACNGGPADGVQCAFDFQCGAGFFCQPVGECSGGECVTTGMCVQGTCDEVETGCNEALPLLEFTGNWDSCLNQDLVIKGATENPSGGRTDGPVVEYQVAGCNDATLAIDFEGGAGCVRVDFTAGDVPTQEQCGQNVLMEFDLP